jgi:AraC family transcriptional regulator
MTLVELADVAGFSPHYFLSIFRNTFGTTPHQYILRERVDEAKALLKHEAASISEIGLMLGFADQSHFTSTFRRIAGMTPSQFRRDV